MPAFQFKDFGTFTGPNSLFGDYKYESASFEVEPAVGGNPQSGLRMYQLTVLSF